MKTNFKFLIAIFFSFTTLQSFAQEKEIEVKVKEKIAVAPVKAVVGAAAAIADDEAGDEF